MFRREVRLAQVPINQRFYLSSTDDEALIKADDYNPCKVVNNRTHTITKSYADDTVWIEIKNATVGDLKKDDEFRILVSTFDLFQIKHVLSDGALVAKSKGYERKENDLWKLYFLHKNCPVFPVDEEPKEKKLTFADLFPTTKYKNTTNGPIKIKLDKTYHPSLPVNMMFVATGKLNYEIATQEVMLVEE